MISQHILDLVGKIFGTLLVVGVGELRKNTGRMMIVECTKHPQFGKFQITKRNLVRTNGFPTCDMCKKRHHLSQTREYVFWERMWKRIKDKNDKWYPHYGERGIDMDPRWDPEIVGHYDGFLNFYNDIGKIPDGLSIDRIDNNKGYYKNNIRFADGNTQGQNRTTTKLTADDVIEIRRLYEQTNMTQNEIAQKFGRKNISNIINRKEWKNV